MLGSSIILTSEPRGQFIEGFVYGTPKPGTCMQVKSGTAKSGGRFTYEVYTPGTDGEQREVLILLEDSLQGKTYADAYVSGERCFLYAPIAGEEFNMRLADVAGTGDDHTVGELLMIDSGTGLLITTTGSPEMESFRCLEAATDPTAEALYHCMYTGH